MISALPTRDQSAWIMAQRPPRARPSDPFKPQVFFMEQERDVSGRIINSAVILLTNKECPWRCLMCDLWQNTLTHTVPAGAIPRQIEAAMAQLGSRAEQVKLYNSGSFFDSAAIPTADYPAIARQVAFVENVVVESHPRLVGEKAARLRDLLSGSLEVAMGLETAHPRVLARMNKKFELRHFEEAAEFLRKEGMVMRAFVLVKPPFMSEEEGLEWAVKSAEFAFARGATVVSLIPTRLGNGAMERLMEAGEFSPPRLSTLEKALELALNLRAGRVFADTWDLESFSTCSVCLDKRQERLRLMNLRQQFLPAVHCKVCGA